MDWNRASQMLTGIKRSIRQAENGIRENTGYIAQIGRLAYEYADNGPSARGRVAEGGIARDMADALSLLEQVEKKLMAANRELNRARDAVAESDQQRANAARKLRI